MSSLLISCLSISFASAASTWPVALEKEGITVRQPSDSSKLELRAEVAVDAPMAHVLTTLLDYPARAQWVPSCTKSVVLDRPQPDSSLVYNYTKTPPLLPDNDVVLSAQTRFLAAERSVEIRLRAVESDRMPPVKGVDRIKQLEGRYLVRPLSAEKTLLVYELNTDLGGSMPHWLVGLIGREAGYRTLSAFRTHAASAAGSEAEAALRQRLQAEGFDRGADTDGVAPAQAEDRADGP